MHFSVTIFCSSSFFAADVFDDELEEVPLFPPWIYFMFLVCFFIVVFSCYKRRQTKRHMVCKHSTEGYGGKNIEHILADSMRREDARQQKNPALNVYELTNEIYRHFGHSFEINRTDNTENETVYRCKTCEKHATAVLCRECFEMSDHRYHDYKELQEKRRGFCHCGLKESWKQDRLCMNHKNELQNMVESRVQYYEFNGHRIPISPDGIPMLNLAKPVSTPKITPLEETVKTTKRSSAGIKGIIMGQKMGLAIAGSRTARTNGTDPLKYAVDDIVKRQEEVDYMEKRKLLGEDHDQDDPYAIGNIASSYIKKSGQMAAIRIDLKREKYHLALKKMRKCQAANHLRFENEIFGSESNLSTSTNV